MFKELRMMWRDLSEWYGWYETYQGDWYQYERDLRKLYLRNIHKLNLEDMDRGPWSVEVSEDRQECSLVSEDFTHDVGFKITGDFGSPAERILYAELLANKLNDVSKDVLMYHGFYGSIKYSKEDKVFHGQILGIPDLVTYESDEAHQLSRSFRDAVVDYQNTKRNNHEQRPI